MSLAALDKQARGLGLAVRGAFHPEPADQAPVGAKTLVLLGPDEPRFWDVFASSAEYADGAANPLDRWSKRVTSVLAADWNADACYPYDGPPYAPFLRWAERSGSCFGSPVGLLVHDTAGLFISFRSALALPVAYDVPANGSNPCLTCKDTPCVTACPVGALTASDPYNVPKCIAHVKGADGAACKEGCLVRRACPVSDRFGRRPEQSTFHMRAFLGQ